MFRLLPEGRSMLKTSRLSRSLWMIAIGCLPFIGGLPLIAAEVQPAMPDLAPRIGAHIANDYYDQTRIKPVLMVQRALRTLESSEASIDTRWQDGTISVIIADRQFDLAAPEPSTLEQAMKLLERVRGMVDKSDLSAERKRDLAYQLVNGALSVLDPHTVVMPPEPANDFREDIAGEFFGIGAFLHQEDGQISIDRVMAGLPADKAGVQDGDVILAVNGEKTAGLSLEQAVRRIKGPKGTTVVLTVERKTAAGAIDISVVRDLVQIITMRSHRAGDVGYIRMDEFNGLTARDLYRSVLELQQNGPMKAFILDLRFNGGGLLDQARLISDFFLPKGEEIVRTVTSDNEPQVFNSSSRQILDIPMVVMTSGGSASAAEILSGCLQRNNRAVVIGATTFGKGSVQTIKDLSDGSRFKVTIQEYQLPGGVSIQDLGVQPDVKLVRHTTRQDGEVDLLPFTNTREVDDEFALKNKAAYEHKSTYELGWLAEYQTLDDLRKSGLAARDFVPDQEASLVISLLQKTTAAPDFSVSAEAATAQRSVRQFLLERMKAPLEEARQNEIKDLAEAFAKRTPSAVVWGEETAVPEQSLTVTFDGPPSVKAGENAALQFTVHNSAEVTVGRLYGLVDADRFSPLWEDEVAFGQVSAKGTVTGVLNFKVPPRLYAGEERFSLHLFVDHGQHVITNVPVVLQVEAQPRPHLGYKWKIIDENKDGILQPGENATVNIDVMNDGQGASEKLSVRVFKDNDPFVQLEEKGGSLAGIAPGAEASVNVPLRILPETKEGNKVKAFSAQQVKLQVRIDERFDENVDARFRATLFHELTIPVGVVLNPKPIIQPKVQLLETTKAANNQVTLTLKVEDDNLRFVTTFLNEDKVDLLSADKLPNDKIYRVTMTLKPGANAIRVAALDYDRLDEVLPIRLWGEGSAPENNATTTVAAPVVKPEAQTPAPFIP
jgi:carboxyl-terminal processing protease